MFPFYVVSSSACRTYTYKGVRLKKVSVEHGATQEPALYIINTPPTLVIMPRGVSQLHNPITYIRMTCASIQGINSKQPFLPLDKPSGQPVVEISVPGDVQHGNRRRRPKSLQGWSVAVQLSASIKITFTFKVQRMWRN